MWILLTLFVFLCTGTFAQAATLDELKREAGQMERARDCEGAYKKYEEVKQLAQKFTSRRRRISLLAFVSTKLSKLKGCYEKCNPTPQDLEFIQRANDYKAKGQSRRAYRILLRLLRGKNPRCSTWKQAHTIRLELAAKLPRRRRNAKQVDPCAMEDTTKDSLKQMTTRVQKLDKNVFEASTPFKMPAPPAPPRWARSKRSKRNWLRRWKRRMRWKMRRKRNKDQVRRLQKALHLFREINEVREKVFQWREEFQDCDQLYTALKSQSTKLQTAQKTAHKVVVDMYEHRIKRVKRTMRWFAKKYRQQKKEQKTDTSTVDSLKTALERQQEMLNNVTQDLLSLSSLLIFKNTQQKEGSLLGNNATALQGLMTDQQKLFAALKKNYPQYLQSSQGRKSLRQHLSTLERFEKVLERFQNQKGGDEKIGKTLQAVRASILVLEKAEEKLASKPVTETTKAMNFSAAGNPAGGTNRTSWGWLLLLSGLGLGAAAVFFILRERKKNNNFEKF